MPVISVGKNIYGNCVYDVHSDFSTAFISNALTVENICSKNSSVDIGSNETTMDCNAICIPNNANNLELQEVQSFYIKNRNNLKCANININSIRYKFSPLADVLQRAMIDILSIQETKLDD